MSNFSDQAKQLENNLRVAMTRRHFFNGCGAGLGTAALASCIPSAFGADIQEKGKQQKGKFQTSPGLSSLPHFAPKAKRAIYLFMSGAPSQMDMFDPKPEMQKWFNKDLPESIRNGQRLTTMTSKQARFPIAPSIYKFKKHGKCGAEVSELLPHTAKMVDDIAIVKSVWTEAINHDPAITYITTGNQLPGRASLGSWLSYGLGSGNTDIPSFVVMTPSWTGRPDAQALFSRLWGSGFLPSKFQGVALRNGVDPVLYLSNPKGIPREARRRMLDSLQKINSGTAAQIGDPETTARIAQYEMAFRMQSSVPELMDLSTESKKTKEMYGPDVDKPGTFAASCLLARRMMERDVRFVQIFHRGWDQHFTLPNHLPKQCKDIDQPAWALIQDLKQRGMLDDTLVIWGGEFGRTIYCQGKLTKTTYGRDHHPRCFTMWMAGAGIKGGVQHGKTDEFCYNILENPVHIRDINATILHQFGIDHEKLSFPVQGLDTRLTGVEPASVIKDILH